MWIENIGAWGDSITYGAGDNEALGWVGRLRRRVEKDHATSVYNFGVSGDTSEDLIKRFETELQSVKPELVLIAIGTNDAIFRKGDESTREVAIETYKADLQKLLELAKGTAQHVFAVGLTMCDESLTQPVPWSKTGKSYKNAILREYDDALEKEAEKAGVLYIKMWGVLTEGDLEDGLHPNDAGYEKMYLKIHEAIKPLLT